ncbi:hypothetical protein BC937DRAFT_91432, partial [Endogone sp. FLAS-F59071]
MRKLKNLLILKCQIILYEIILKRNGNQGKEMEELLEEFILQDQQQERGFIFRYYFILQRAQHHEKISELLLETDEEFNNCLEEAGGMQT